MFKNPSFLFDIVCTGWLILVCAMRARAFSSIVQLVGNVFSLLGAQELSSACAGWVFEHLLAGELPHPDRGEHLAAGGAVDLTGIADKYAGFLPQSFRASIVAACERSIWAVLTDNAVVLADTIVQKVLLRCLPRSSLVLFFRVLRPAADAGEYAGHRAGPRQPAAGNRHRQPWLGWVVGCGTSTMDIYLVLCVVWAFVITGGNLTVLNDTVMSSSLYYKVFNLFNPFL